MKRDHDTEPQRDADRSAHAGGLPIATTWWREAGGLLLAVLGAALCVRAYLQQHSLFMDEARLLESVLTRGWAELYQPLGLEQAAPVGFVYLLKLSIAVIGDDKLGFRAVPMAAAVASMFLFWMLVRQLVKGWPAWVGMGVFALCTWVTYYAQQTKQYTVELAVALLLLVMFDRLARRGLTPMRLAALAIVGTMSVWFSVTAIIVLAGIGVVLLVLAVRGSRQPMVAAVLVVGVLWVGSFLLQYALTLQAYRGSDYLAAYWEPFYLRVIPRLPHRVFGQLAGVFIHPVGLPFHQVGFVLWVLGMAVAVQTKRALPWAMVAGWSVLVLLSFLQQYPYGDRQVIFALPILIGMLAMGVGWLDELGQQGRALAVGVSFLLLAGPLFTAGQVEADDALEPVLLELREHVEPGDVVWVDRGAMYMVQFLQARSDAFDLSPATVQFTDRLDGQRHWVFDELQAFDGQPRVWLLMTHAMGRDGVDELNYVTLLARQMGRRLDHLAIRDTSATLFDFSVAPEAPPTPAGPPELQDSPALADKQETADESTVPAEPPAPSDAP